MRVGRRALGTRSDVAESTGFIHPFTEEESDVLEEKLTALLERDDVWTAAGREIGGLGEDPRIAEDTAPDEHPGNPVGIEFLHHVLGLHAIAAAEYRNRQPSGHIRNE